MSKVKLIVIPVVIVVVAGVALYLYLSIKKSPVILTPPTPRSATSESAAGGSEALGAKIYGQSANPIKDKVPTVSPVVNPVQGLYKNPF